MYNTTSTKTDKSEEAGELFISKDPSTNIYPQTLLIDSILGIFYVILKSLFIQTRNYGFLEVTYRKRRNFIAFSSSGYCLSARQAMQNLDNTKNFGKFCDRCGDVGLVKFRLQMQYYGTRDQMNKCPHAVRRGGLEVTLTKLAL